MTNLTASRVRELFDYDKKTGLLTWRKNRRGRFGNPGDEAGSVSVRGHVRIGIDNRVYLAARVIFLYVTGAMPNRVIYRDGDRQNLKWANLADSAEGYSMKKHARIARERRAVRKEAVETIKQNPDLLYAYQLSPKDAASVMRTVCKRIRTRRMNNRANSRMPDDDGELA